MRKSWRENAFAVGLSLLLGTSCAPEAASDPDGGLVVEAGPDAESDTLGDAGADERVDAAPIVTPFTPPYALPNAGEVVRIGSNTAMDIVPPGMTKSEWDYSLFNSFGGGTFVEDFSAAGAYVLAGTGGHGHPRNVGAAVFDFADASWKRVDPSGGASYGGDYRVAETNGAPFYEVSGTPVPAPPHPYQTLCPLPARLGGGTRGSVLYVTRSAIAGEAASSPAVHQFDLATGAWTRRTESLAVTSQPESSAVFDAARDRYWFMPYGLHNYKTAHFLDAKDWTFKTVGAFPDWPSAALEVGRVFMHKWSGGSLVIRQGTGETLWAFDPDRADLGWIRLLVKGVLPGNGNVFAAADDGRYYWISKNGGNTVVRLTPPAKPTEGTWVVDTIELRGPIMPERTRTYGFLNHYTGLFYVPALRSMAWIAGGENQVSLWRPPT